MSQKPKLAAFALLLLATLAAFGTLPAQAIPTVPLPGYSASAIDSALGEACEVATAIVENHCRIHGEITTSYYDCHNVLSEDGTHLELSCWCKASTRLCIH